MASPPEPAPAPRRQGIDRSRGYDPAFSLARHAARTGAVVALVAVAGAGLARDAPAWALAEVPCVWVLANFVEWSVHRYPMHHPMVPRVLFRNHTQIHHRAFRGAAMEIERGADLGLVMMPWYTLLLIFAATSPLALLVGATLGPPHAGVFLLSAAAYFVMYELVHTVDHLPARALRGPRPLRELARWLRAHHHHHHQPANMTRVNFNVTVPLADLVLGTLERP